MDPVIRTRELARRYFDGLVSAEEAAELQRLLQTSPEAADAFACSSRLEGALSELFAQDEAVRREGRLMDAIDRQQRRRRWLGRAARVAVAACLLLGVLGPLLAWLSWRYEEPGPRREVEVVGTLEQRD